MIGLALEGGGAKGAFQVGVIRALEEEGLEFSGIAGTSIGSLNGAYYIQEGLESLEKIWLELEIGELVENADLAKLALGEFSLDRISGYIEAFSAIVAERGLDPYPLYNFIDKHIDEDKIRKSGKDYGLATFNQTDLRGERLNLSQIEKGSLAGFIFASCSLPIFSRMEVRGKVYLDGAFIDNLPYSILQDLNYRKIYCVRLDSRGLINIPKEDENFVIIKPRRPLGGMLNFNEANIKNLISRGYNDARIALGRAYGESYTFTGNRERFTYKIFDYSEESIERLAKYIMMPGVKTKEGFQMYLLATLGKILGLEAYPSAFEIGLKALEIVLAINEVELDQAYDLEEALALAKTFKMKKVDFYKEKEKLAQLLLRLT